MPEGSDVIEQLTGNQGLGGLDQYTDNKRKRRNDADDKDMQDAAQRKAEKSGVADDL